MKEAVYKQEVCNIYNVVYIRIKGDGNCLFELFHVLNQDCRLQIPLHLAYSITYENLNHNQL